MTGHYMDVSYVGCVDPGGDWGILQNTYRPGGGEVKPSLGERRLFGESCGIFSELANGS